jgi:HemY protein
MRVFARAILVFLGLAALSVVAWQIAIAPGEVALEWHGWRVDTSAGVLFVATIAVFVAGAALYRLWRGIGGLPRRVRTMRELGRREAGFHALTQGMVAIAAGDAAEARRHAKRASELLGRPPGALLIGAQAAQLEGRADLARKFYDAMLEAEETELLGLRGLLALAEQEGEREKALELAERARKLAPRTPWVLTRLFHLEIAARRWEAAEQTLRQAIAVKAVTEGSGRRSDAVLLVQLSLMAERNGDRPLALERARRALELDEALLPASLQLAALHYVENEPRRARRAIEAAWQRAPHPDLARLYALVGGEVEPVKRYRALARLEELQPAHAETHRALARAALDAKLWGEARRHLAAGRAAAADAGFHRLEAELAESEHGDAAAARDWLAKAATAEPETAWLCRGCGAQAGEWSALCGHCGDFDTLSWGRPPRVRALKAAPASAGGAVVAADSARVSGNGADAPPAALPQAGPKSSAPAAPPSSPASPA